MTLITSWSAIISWREHYLKQTDLWYLKDRWDTLNNTEKGKLNAYREALRNITSYHPDLAAAQANWPEAEDWFVIRGSEGDVLDWEMNR